MKACVGLCVAIVVATAACGIHGSEVLAAASLEHRLPSQGIAFLGDMTRDVIESSKVRPGSNGGGNWPITNSCGFALITPGKDTYRAFWVRDFSMAVDSGFIGTDEMRDHLTLVCRVQNGPQEKALANGLHVPAWAIPDHINYDGRPVWFPGSYSSGDDQGAGACGRLPPIDDHYEFVHIAHALYQATHDKKFLKDPIGGISVFVRLEKAFASPAVDSETGLAQTTEGDRAVGFGFCDAEVHTGKLLFASLLRYRAAAEMAELARALGSPDLEAAYKGAQAKIRSHISKTFAEPVALGGWLRASTGRSSQPDVWGTIYALHLGVLNSSAKASARKAVLAAVKAGTIEFEGAVRHVPTDRDFSKSSAWERSLSPVNTYQNGAYWHTASGWLIEALWLQDQVLALRVFEKMFTHLRTQDFRKGHGNGAPWEAFGPNGQARQNPIYLASVALPYAVLRSQTDGGRSGH